MLANILHDLGSISSLDHHYYRITTHYQFISAEIKEKAFRFDGIFMPDREDKPLYFVEVQFQNKPNFYWEFISEINLYLNQYKPKIGKRSLFLPNVVLR
jgi:predicted transposase YdaD